MGSTHAHTLSEPPVSPLPSNIITCASSMLNLHQACGSPADVVQLSFQCKLPTPEAGQCCMRQQQEVRLSRAQPGMTCGYSPVGHSKWSKWKMNATNQASQQRLQAALSLSQLVSCLNACVTHNPFHSSFMLGEDGHAPVWACPHAKVATKVSRQPFHDPLRCT